MHVTTRESLMAGGERIDGSCPVCCRENQPIRIGHVEEHCAGCGNYFNRNEQNKVVRARRELLDLSRDQISAITGISVSTIKHYEVNYPSKKYLSVTENLVLERFEPGD